MRSPSRRTTKLTGLAAAPLAIVLAGVMVWQGSTAAFTADTRNAGNSWSAGQVTLTDDDQGRAGFTVENLVPGDGGEQCIVVTSGSTVPGEVRAYVENLSESSGLAEHIELQVLRGTGGSFGDCTGFVEDPDQDFLAAQPLSTLATVNGDYASGGAAWTVAGDPPEQTTYKGVWSFDTSGMTQQEIDALQGTSVSIDLVWELQTDTAA